MKRKHRAIHADVSASFEWLKGRVTDIAFNRDRLESHIHNVEKMVDGRTEQLSDDIRRLDDRIGANVAATESAIHRGAEARSKIVLRMNELEELLLPMQSDAKQGFEFAKMLEARIDGLVGLVEQVNLRHSALVNDLGHLDLHGMRRRINDWEVTIHKTLMPLSGQHARRLDALEAELSQSDGPVEPFEPDHKAEDAAGDWMREQAGL